ncbi:DUF3368 domain-containing protein [Chroococcidiopsis sp. CCALA 051]|uniref:DUF3368 domain-containing protein n=1 Tax=Chroococcidiopsis sp. CCALA 051 TaxID=869949 RepID=UPI000D0CEE4F|nr:DUF3368 domain-containing protein [Chroococcidiopsis sp. CCALA 051]PSM46956.1 DUF3368 domain-containing protein [Chroococcidiopsis sp. CCALA 051]
MPVVSNTSPILNLAIIGQLKLMHQQFGQVQIPPAVLSELKVQEERPGSSEIQASLKAGWIEVQEINSPLSVQLLQQTLDRGEAEAIALAMEVQANWTLLDERDGRKVAKSLGLRVTGVLGILLQAKQKGELHSLSEAINALVATAGFRIAPDLLAKVIAAENQS